MTFKAGTETSDDETVEGKFTVEVPAGYHVSSPETWPSGISISSDHRTITFEPDEDIQTDLGVTITKGTFGAKGDSPAGGWLVVTLGVLLALGRPHE